MVGFQQAPTVIGNAVAKRICNAYDRGMSPIQRVVSYVGSQAALADRLSIKQPTVSQWVLGLRPIPAERCPDLERESEGSVRCEELRPDLTWARVADKGWRWHRKGRPVLDLTKAAA